MKRLSGMPMLSCVFASALLIHAAFHSQNAVAGPSGAVRTQIVQAQPGLRVAENKEAAAATDANAALEILIRRDKEKRANSEKAAGKTDPTEKEEPPVPAIVKEPFSLYPTAAQCGQCHKQIYEEWSSSQHAYASISP